MTKTTRQMGLAAACALAALLSSIGGARADEVDARIAYELGRAALERGDEDEAYRRLRESCMASEPVVDGCLEWGRLADRRGEDGDVKRALGSAVMFAPEDPRARLAMAEILLAKGDWTWAIEHLTAGVEHAENDADRALLRFYLGYARFHDGAFEEAAVQLSLAQRELPPELAQQAAYYRGLVAREQQLDAKAAAMMKLAEGGPSARVAEAAAASLASWTAFPRPDGFAGQAIASFGLNTHPAVAFLDQPGVETDPALQSVFRGDLLYATDGYANGFQGMLTLYREQNWVELGDGGDDGGAGDAGEEAPPSFAPSDMNITLMLLQLAYIGRARLGGLEHELRVGADGEMQFLDHPPVQTGSEGTWAPDEDPFGLFTFALGGKLWWTMAASEEVETALRLKVEVRPNRIDADRSSVRTRLRLLHTRWFFDRTLQLKLLAGGRYDRAYRDPAVVKYDRLLPEGHVDLKWVTPIPRLTLLAGAGVEYNWYLNSKKNAENSFRPPYIDNPDFGAADNERFEAEYYDLARHDFEWDALVEARVEAWRRATVALRYSHRQRLSNLDEAPVPLYDAGDGFEPVPRAKYGYRQDLVVLEVVQRF